MPQNYDGADFLHGGYDRNIMQSDQPADRLLDWADNDELIKHCVLDKLKFFEDLVLGMGALDPDIQGASGFRELGLPDVFVCADVGS